MEKIFLYIKQGKGHGLLFLLATAVISTLLFSVNLKTVLNEIKPKALLVAEDFLPIEIKDQKLVSHPDTYKRVDLNLNFNEKDNVVLPIILDTKNSTTTLAKEKTAIVISKDYFYIHSPQKIEKIEYQDGSYDINYFKSFLEKTSTTLASTLSFTLMCFFFITFLLKTTILMFLNSLILKIKNIPSKKDILMRLSALCISFSELLNILTSTLINLQLNTINTFILAFLVSLIYLKNNQEKQE